MADLEPLADELTVEAVAARVSAIELLRDDPETAHYEEDEAYKAVLRAIADGSSVSNPAELAREVLRIDELPFSRWYA